MRAPTVGVGAVLLAWGLACSGGGDEAATDEAATDEAATDEATDGAGDDDEGEDDAVPGDRAARNDCRLGLKGVLVGVPGWRAGDDHRAATAPLVLRTAPRADGRIEAEFDRAGTLSKPEGAKSGGKARPICHWREGKADPDCMAVLFSREAFALPVYQERRGWVQVAYGEGGVVPVHGEGCRKRAWVEVKAPLAYLEAEKLIEDAGMPETLPNWDGVLYDGPDGAPKPTGAEGAVPFRKGRTARAGGRLWLEATLIDTHCDTKVERQQGWIPVTDKDGRLQVWFDTEC